LPQLRPPPTQRCAPGQPTAGAAGGVTGLSVSVIKGESQLERQPWHSLLIIENPVPVVEAVLSSVTQGYAFVGTKVLPSTKLERNSTSPEKRLDKLLIRGVKNFFATSASRRERRFFANHKKKRRADALATRTNSRDGANIH
jgi:hypothetical protein